jgi:hypothetical protein
LGEGTVPGNAPASSKLRLIHYCKLPLILELIGFNQQFKKSLLLLFLLLLLLLPLGA